MKTITLSNEVMVSDPCYEVPTWCQHKLTNVLPGEYQCTVAKFQASLWGERCSFIIAVHKDYNTDEKLNWRTVKAATIGVDSAQAGFFSMETYRKDEIFVTGQSEHSKRWGSHKNDGGDEWYGHMCDLSDIYKDKWGTYPNGIVSSSGIGDGSYELRVAKHKGKIVGMVLDFGIEKLSNQVIEMIRETELLGDVCVVCGGDNVEGVTCNCKM
jgi:hypothetical protein